MPVIDLILIKYQQHTIEKMEARAAFTLAPWTAWQHIWLILSVAAQPSSRHVTLAESITIERIVSFTVMNWPIVNLHVFYVFRIISDKIWSKLSSIFVGFDWLISPGDSRHTSHWQSVIVKLTAMVTVALCILAHWVVWHLRLTLFVVSLPSESRQLTIGDNPLKVL
jgi:hypothetical protein